MRLHEWLISGDMQRYANMQAGEIKQVKLVRAQILWFVTQQLTNTRQLYLFPGLLQTLFSQKRIALSSPSVKTVTRVEVSHRKRSVSVEILLYKPRRGRGQQGQAPHQDECL